MTRIYISEAGDDRNDGLTRETAIHSWQRAVKLCDGNAETNLTSLRLPVSRSNFVPTSCRMSWKRKFSIPAFARSRRQSDFAPLTVSG